MDELMRKRVVWFAVFMLWMGLVTSVLVYKENHKTTLTNADASLPGNTQVNEQLAQGTDFNGSTEDQQNSTAGTAIGSDSASTEAGKDAEPGPDFFMEHRIDRDKQRSDQIDEWQQMINNANTDPAIKKELQKKVLRLSEIKEQETQIEILLRGRGYADALSWVQDDGVKVIVVAPGLTEADVAKIFDIVTSVTRLPQECIDVTHRWDGKK